MSGGFPVRISRSSLGPTPVDRAPVVDPERQLGASTGDLIMWQLAGVNVAGDLAWCSVDSTGAFVDGGEAWDPDDDQADPVCSRLSQGIYSVVYDATYPDREGVARTVALRAAFATPQTETRGIGAVAKVQADGRTVIVTVFTTADGSYTDESFALSVK